MAIERFFKNWQLAFFEIFDVTSVLHVHIPRTFEAPSQMGLLRSWLSGLDMNRSFFSSDLKQTLAQIFNYTDAFWQNEI